MTDPLVKIHDLRVVLGGNAILRSVTTNLAREQITALIGLNGSGKTTLLRAILKEIPYSGQVEFRCGHDHSRPTPQYVGYVPQRLRIDANLPLTVRDLLALALQRRPLFLGVGRRTTQLMKALLDRVWMAHDLLDRPVEKLSGGELQRVLLALALEPAPELLLLDEPAAGIDFQHEQKFYELIAELNRQTKVTIVLVSHELSVVSRHAHHVICLKDGRVRCEGRPEEIVAGEMLDEIFGQEKGVYAHRHGHEPAAKPPVQIGEG
jgi:zinc transport system ATP-binding protein